MSRNPRPHDLSLLCVSVHANEKPREVWNNKENYVGTNGAGISKSYFSIGEEGWGERHSSSVFTVFSRRARSGRKQQKMDKIIVGDRRSNTDTHFQSGGEWPKKGEGGILVAAWNELL